MRIRHEVVDADNRNRHASDCHRVNHMPNTSDCRVTESSVTLQSRLCRIKLIWSARIYGGLDYVLFPVFKKAVSVCDSAQWEPVGNKMCGVYMPF